MATGLGIHRVEIEDVPSFYAFSDRTPRGRSRIRLSETPISFMKGAQAVADPFEAAPGVAVVGTTQDGAITLQWTSDIGMADQKPAALIDGMSLTERTPDYVPEIVAALGKAGGDGRQHPVPPPAAREALPR
jgi:[NiFe] hydrogenase diaphorase moiety large subunit